MASAEQIHMTDEFAPWAHFGWRHAHLLFHQPLAKVEELDRFAILRSISFCRFLPWGYGLVSMDYNGHIMISPWYNGLPKWRYHGDIMGIWSGLNGLVEQLLVVFWKQWILPLGKVTSTFPANCPNLGIGSRKVLKETHFLLEFSCALRSSTLSPERFAMLWNLSLEPTTFKGKEFDPFCFPAIYDRCIN